jgi:hypothetical protein
MVKFFIIKFLKLVMFWKKVQKEDFFETYIFVVMVSSKWTIQKTTSTNILKMTSQRTLVYIKWDTHIVVIIYLNHWCIYTGP